MSRRSSGILRRIYLYLLAVVFVIYFFLLEESNHEMPKRLREIEEPAVGNENASAFKEERVNRRTSRYHSKELFPRRRVPTWDSEKELKWIIDRLSPLLAIFAQTNHE